MFLINVIQWVRDILDDWEMRLADYYNDKAGIR